MEASSETKLRKALSYIGNNNPAWKGGVAKHSSGYVLIASRDHPFAVTGYVLGHRLVVEERMRREAPGHHFLVEIEGIKYLRRDIDVHHKNEVKADNDPENLIACTAAAHKDMHQGRPVMRGCAWPANGAGIEFTDRKVALVCECCGGSFTKGLADVKRGAGRYCSRACYDASPRMKRDSKS